MELKIDYLFFITLQYLKSFIKNNMKKYIPNFITGLNAVSGCIAVYMAFKGLLIHASIFIFIGALFDFFDGMSARLLKAYSDMGKELDSLSDMISFGFAPAAIAYALLSRSIRMDLPELFEGNLKASVLLIPFIMVMFSGLRLAKFNIDTRQSTSFIGIPTPANAILWASFPIILEYGDIEWIKVLVNNEYFIIILALLMSPMLTAEIPMFSFKMKSLSLKDNYTRYIFLLTTVVLVAIVGISFIAFMIPMYILFSIVENIILNKKA